MAAEYLPILIMIVLSTGFAAIAIIVPSLLGPKRSVKAKLEPYESGMIPFADARRRMPVQYYMTAVLFLLFDIEVIFLYPWAVTLGVLKWFSMVQMGIFLLILVVGFIYEWKKGALDWD